MSYEDLRGFFATHIVELVAVRRNKKINHGVIRAFLCTNSRAILNNISGKAAFHFKPPTQPPSYDAKKYNLLTVFDLFMQDYRNINLNNYVIKDALPVKTREEITMFWAYFQYVLKQMSSADKTAFMDNRGYRSFTIDSIKKHMEETQNEENMQEPLYEDLII